MLTMVTLKDVVIETQCNGAIRLVDWTALEKRGVGKGWCAYTAEHGKHD